VHYLRAQQVQQALRAMLRRVFQRYDVLVTPTSPVEAPPVDDSALAGGEPPPLTRLTQPFSLVGLPAVSVPCGFTRAGLPIGLQIVGRPFAEAVVLNAAYAYEQATAWHERHPAL
jgi:aspartyl-tRNA(Asn)/glutamyl-tRNA(Gln) amidotransferase subunit A